MTRVEYDLLRKEEPHLRLPAYWNLRDQERDRLHQLTREELIVSRTYILLARDIGVVDALR